MVKPSTKLGSTDAAAVVRDVSGCSIHPASLLNKAHSGQIAAEFTTSGRAIFEHGEIVRFAREWGAARSAGGK